MTQFSKIFFMLRKLKRDLFNRSDLHIAADIQSMELKEYYLVFEDNPKKLNRLIVDFDENGIPMNTTYIDVEEKKLHYYPISIGQFALAIFHNWLQTGNIEKKEHFLRIAKWFYDSRTEDSELGTYWLTDVPKPEHQITSAWKSAFSQSRALSVLLRAWQLTNDNKYLEVCKKALIPFTKDIKEGGVAIRRKAGETFYEEYVAKYPTRVIDGHIFSLFGLYDFVRAVPPELDIESHELAKKLFNEGVNGLANQWKKLDLGFWIRYSLSEVPGYPVDDPCTVSYLRLIGTQLRVLKDLHSNPEIVRFYEKIKSVDNFTNILKMYRLKFKSLKKLNRL